MTYEELFVTLLEELPSKPPPPFSWLQMMQVIKGKDVETKLDLEQIVPDSEIDRIKASFRARFSSRKSIERHIEFSSMFLRQFLKSE